VIEFIFAPDDVARVRFAFSSLSELTHSLRVLQDPSGHALHLPWVHAVRPRLSGIDMTLLRALVPAHGYMPDFLTPAPLTPLPDFAAELETVRATRPETLVEELGWVAYSASRWPDPELDQRRRELLIADPVATLARIVDVLPLYWEAAIAPYWTKMRDLLEGEILRRSRALAVAGAEGLFGDLHGLVRWSGDRLRIDKCWPVSTELGGLGIVLVPSIFSWPDVLVMMPPYQPSISYPPQGVATLWETSPAPPPDALAALIGARRAALLEALAAPASTGELARRLNITAGAVSQHLGVLRGCGLVTGHRVGRRVLYARTGRGDMLLRAES
jgi:DNA-binding transcriptional ArsR family regulator